MLSCVKIGIVGIFIGTLISTLLTVWWREGYLLYKDLFKKSVIKYYSYYLFWFLVTISVGFLFWWICKLIPISILLLGVAIITLVLGILTLAKVLPLPAGQIPIAIVLVVVGVLALAGSIVLAVFRSKKKKALLERKDEILKQDQDLKDKESNIDNRTPRWYKDALWTVEGNVVRNASQRHELKK